MQYKAVLKQLAKPLTLLNRHVKKKKNRILIYSNLGFRDNVKAIFTYLIEHDYQERYEIICSLNDYRVQRAKGVPGVKYVGNLAGLFYFFTSRYMFYSFGKYPIKPSEEQIVVNLWHGMPLKTVGNLVAGQETTDYHFFTHTIATSAFFGEIMQKCFQCPSEEVLLFGQPRCDVLFTKKIPLKKEILWMPTYRSSDTLGKDTESSPFLPLQTEKQYEALNACLRAAGYMLLIKPHPLQRSESLSQDFSNIVLLEQQEEKALYERLIGSAALITDYSSIYFDYLLLDKPIGFTISDLQEYQDKRGFTVKNPQEWMPGMKIKTFDAFMAFVQMVISEQDPYQEQRREVNRIVNANQCGEASRKILEAIGL